MKKQLLIVASLFLLAGCSTLPRTVEVPVPLPCPAPPLLPSLELPLEKLGPEISPAEKMRGFVLIIEKQVARIRELEELLDAYRPRDKP